jgi:hypothetical protein
LWWLGAGLGLGEAFDGVQSPVPLLGGGSHGPGGLIETLRADGVADFAAVPMCARFTGPAGSCRSGPRQGD